MNILFEDACIVVVNKPAGLSTESGPAAHPSAEKEVQAMFANTAPRAYLRAVHRLDRASSGVLVLARSKAMLTALMTQFEQRSVEKIYQAIVDHPLPAPQGALVHWLKRDESGKKALVFDREMPGTQAATMQYRVLDEQNGRFLLEIQPLTGRFHQIRAQLAHIGCPIEGDLLYGGKTREEYKIKLHACRLSFAHPRTQAPMTIEAPWDAWA